MSYISLDPVAQRSSYKPNETIEFLLNFENLEIILNSVRLSGDVKVRNATTDAVIDASDVVLMDHAVGFESLVSSYTTYFNDANDIVEYIDEYPRMLKNVLTTKTSNLQMGMDSKYLTAGTSIGTNSSVNVLDGDQNSHTAHFSLKPTICLNQTFSNIPYNKTKDIKLRIRLAPPDQVLFGTNAEDYTYTIENLRLHYRAQPQKHKGPLRMLVNQLVRQQVQSNNASLQINVPFDSTNVFGSFMLSTDLTSTTKNYLDLQNVDITRLVFSFNDQTNSLNTFPLETKQEISWNYENSTISSTLGFAQYSPRLNQLRNYDKQVGIGIYFQSFVQNTKIGVNLESTISDPTSVFLFFTGLAQV